MKTLHYQKPNNLSLLHDEITAAIPSLAPERDADGLGTPVMKLRGLGDDIWLTVPDGADEAAIAAVVQAHDQSMTQPNPRAERLARIAEINEVPRSTWTTAQLRELIHLVALELSS